MAKKTQKVVIVGAGFAGINCAKKLANKKGVAVKLIDRRNYHLFQPLLYQVAMAGLSPAEIAYPVRSLFSGALNVDVILGTVDEVQTEKKQVVGDFGAETYDTLILACGAQHSYFGHDEWEEWAPGLKTLEQATEIRKRVLSAFERAENNPDKSEELLTFVVVGGGPTGVEVAGALGEIKRFTLSRDFRHLHEKQARIILIEAGDRILAPFDPELSRKAEKSLEELGVEIWTNSMVKEITQTGVSLGERSIKSATVLWAAGVEPSKLNDQIPGEKDKAGRIKITKTLKLLRDKDIYVLGDQAHCPDEEGNPLPGLAAVAIQQGRQAAKNILRELKGKAPQEFHYFDKGQLATIGRNRAVMQIHGLKLSGFTAWLAWLVVHIYYLIGFRNRMIVFMQWAWHYFTYKHGARLIVHKEWRSHKKTQPPE